MLIRALCIWVLLFCATQTGAQDTTAVHPDLVATLPASPEGRLGHIMRRGTLIVGVKSDYPPWGMVSPTEELIGLEADLAADLAARMGVALELRAVTARNRIGRVNDGVVDVVIATTGDTEQRRLQADLLLPNYYSGGAVVYSRADANLRSWDDVRGQKLCLNQGAYYNHSIVETYQIQPLYFTGSRESRLALLRGHCIGWAFDDTVLTQFLLAQPAQSQPADVFEVLDETILISPWSIIVAKSEGKADLGRFVSDMIGEWHASGRILALQDKWNIPRTDYIAEKHALWSSVQADGTATCARDPKTGAHPEVCLASNPFPSREKPKPFPWMVFLEELSGLDLSAFADPSVRERVLTGLWLTLGLSAAAIVGALSVGLVLAIMQAVLVRLGAFGQILLLPQRVLITVARMTPPILQLYIVYFGLAGELQERFSLTPTAFAIAVVILSFYAGATNAVILSHALEDERQITPQSNVFKLLPSAILRGFDGLVAACVNIVKAAGMASAIAVSELISTINVLVSEGADVVTMMNGLLVFYFLLVLVILWLFRAARGIVIGKP